jgi:toxin YoeB
MRRRIVFENDAFKEFNEWGKFDKKIHNKIIDLIRDTNQNPFKGLGMPEPLKFDYKGFWSRRINEEHRLIYRVTEDEIIIVSCKYHY